MPVVCPKCATPVGTGNLFCPECGTSTAALQAQLETVPVGMPDSGGAGAMPSTLTSETSTGTDRADDSIDKLREATLGEFEIMGMLGRGGMASVYLAHEIALDRKVAIKVMLPDILRIEGMTERFKREARTAANLGHPHIIPIFGVRQSGDSLYFIMKYVEGRPLDSVIRELGQIPFDMARTVMTQVGNALDFAHRRGVVHRDIKPANIMLDVEGWAVVTDFGIAKVSEASGLTVSGNVVGTPFYMSPEQAADHPLSGAADQYSLGILAYEMVTGRLPFTNSSLMSLLIAHREDTPPPIESLRPDCPEPMRHAIERMIAKDPEARFPTLRDASLAFAAASNDNADAVRTAMITLAKSNPRPILRVSTPRSPAPKFSPRQQSVNTAKGRRGLRGPTMAVLAVVLTAAVGLWMQLTQASRANPEEGSPPAAQAPAAAPPNSVPPAADSTPLQQSIASNRQPGDRRTRAADSISPSRATPAPATTSGTGWIRIGVRPDTIAHVLYINGGVRGALTGLQNYAAAAGQVRVQIRGDGCATWDSTVSVIPDSVSTIGYRKSSCP